MLDFSAYPRFPLTHRPTPLERAERLEQALHQRSSRVPRLWIKRDDCTGLATGGNKTRKLEFLIGAALAQGADSVVTIGATQSNHVRQTAAAAAKAGLDCHLLLERRVDGDLEYEKSGNVLLDELLGGQVTRLPQGADVRAEAEAFCESLRASGSSPYSIAGGGSSALGALGYAVAAEEIDSALPDCTVVHATGSMGTQAGLVAGFAARGSSTHVVGVSVRQSAAEMLPKLRTLTVEAAGLLGVASADARWETNGRWEVDDRWVGEGYGIPTEAMVDAVRLIARTEGVLLDPVYSGKALSGLIGMISEGRFSEDEDVVFLHTGGTPALFAYRSTFAAA